MFYGTCFYYLTSTTWLYDLSTNEYSLFKLVAKNN